MWNYDPKCFGNSQPSALREPATIRRAAHLRGSGRLTVDRRKHTTGTPRPRQNRTDLWPITTELVPTLTGRIPPGNHGKPVTAAALTLP